MRFQKGQPRPPNAGRKKGTKNKLTLVQEQIGNWFHEGGLPRLIEMAESAATPRSVKVGIIQYIGDKFVPDAKITVDLKSANKETLTIEHLHIIADRIKNAKQES